MSIHLHPSSFEALAATNEALRAVDRFLKCRARKEIDAADAMISKAVELDANYAIAILYRGIVHDLRGTPAEAIPFFERILELEGDPFLSNQARFGMGVALYHQYSRDKLERARACLEPLADQSGDNALSRHSRAILAQVHAMWMRPIRIEKEVYADHQELHTARTHFSTCNEILKSLGNLKDDERAIAAPAHNARGMANMYLADFAGVSDSERDALLMCAESALKDADRLLPRDWANVCDLGSLHLRKGVFSLRKGNLIEAESHFRRAKQCLEFVASELRPGYGFAFYELGVLHRVWDEFGKAQAYLNQAGAIPGANRDVSDSRLKAQLDRVEQRDSQFP